ncbi:MULTISPECIES: hypothetical protein [unclassified Dietzia]|uniref:hypothetical protein n=1 Tax=unclassified Dietzia TaxID=2617939 RepID=UPI000D212E2E|nr:MULTISPECIES: hypothetical protein [unclassified Dietzia]AVZ40258.1 hypothetical protein CT688_13065 [Dietzia sp. JS16-p6b]QGW25729.1 hypothetical protein GJR88_04147 [Dietzia sp. DQ12-45-1b]
MNRPLSVSIASWIWVFCGLFTTITIAGVISATDALSLVSGLWGDEVTAGGAGVGLSGAGGPGWTGWALATVLFAALVVQVTTAPRLRAGERRSRALLTTAASVSLMAVVYDPTLWSAWLLLVANAVALLFTYDDHALDYLETRPEQLASAH